MLRRSLILNFSAAGLYHDDIISDSFASIIESAGKLKESQRDRKMSLKNFVYACLHFQCEMRALRALKTFNRRAEINTHRQTDGDDNRRMLTTVLQSASQEEIVFLKQALEKFGGLGEEERALLRTMFDYADLSEMCKQAPSLSALGRAIRFGSQNDLMKAWADAKITFGRA